MASLLSTYTFVAMLCFALFIQGSLQNSVYHKFGEVFRRSVTKQCTTNRDCAPSECCVIPRTEAEVSVGVCRKMPVKGDACDISASSLQCPCISGTTCAKLEMYQTKLRLQKVSTVSSRMLDVHNYLIIFNSLVGHTQLLTVGQQNLTQIGICAYDVFWGLFSLR